jgi:hypothetical protein
MRCAGADVDDPVIDLRSVFDFKVQCDDAVKELDRALAEAGDDQVGRRCRSPAHRRSRMERNPQPPPLAH